MELFKPPFGFIFHQLGGVPVDRSGSNNFVDQIVNIFNSNESLLLLCLPGEQKRKLTRLRTGFYHITQKANVPMVLLAVDFEYREFRFSDPIFTTTNEAEDIKAEFFLRKNTSIRS